MSATRLLVLGAVRIFQPVHGYLVRRELMSWQVDQWANLNPGSVYNALRSLTREGYLEETGTEAEGRRPARTSYQLTGDGEYEFRRLLHDALWNVSTHEPAELMAGWSFAWALTRTEVIEALEHRLTQIDGITRHSEFAIDEIRRIPEKPDTVVEHFRLTTSRLQGEANWIRDVVGRLRAGEYWFDGEPDRPWSAPAQTLVPQPAKS